jgi:hypothetical protein
MEAVAAGIGGEVGKVLGDRSFPTREDEIRVDFGERLKDEPPEVGAGMGQGEAG